MSLKKYLLGSAAVFGALVEARTGTRAKPPSVTNQIQSLQHQVRYLNEAMQSLQSQVVQTWRNAAMTSETVTEMKMAPAPASPAGSAIVKMINGEPATAPLSGRSKHARPHGPVAL